MKSGTLKLLEPSGPVQACNGITLPLLTLSLHWFVILSNIDLMVPTLTLNLLAPTTVGARINL